MQLATSSRHLVPPPVALAAHRVVARSAHRVVDRSAQRVVARSAHRARSAQRVSRRTRGPARAVIVVVAAIACALIALAPLRAPSAFAAASADSPVMPDTYLIGGAENNGVTTLSAFVKAGEVFSFAFRNDGDAAHGGAHITARRSDGSVFYDREFDALATDDARGSIAAPVDGVYSVDVRDTHQLGATYGASLVWDVEVASSAGVRIPGRVFTDSLGIHQDGPSDLSLWGVSETGVVYRETLRDYFGIDSTLQITNKGNVLGSDQACTPIYKSVPMRAEYAVPVSPDACPGYARYRMFLERPAADLPAESSAWPDGRTGGRWLLPPYQAITLTDLAYTRSGANSDQGTIRATLPTQPGRVVVRIDTDGDGSFSGAADRAIETIRTTSGPFELAWDGLDAHGVAVPPTRALRFSAEADRGGEAHFLRVDGELSPGGIEVDRLTGPNTATENIHFDDSLLSDSPGRYSRSAPLVSGDAGLNSSGGVHRWVGDDSGADRTANANDGVHGSWGDLRSIDDWMFTPERASADFQLTPLQPQLTITKTQDADVPVPPSGRISYRVTVTNSGTTAARGVQVTDAFLEPQTVNALLNTAAAKASTGTVSNPSGTVTIPSGAVSAGSGPVLWAIGDLDAGASATLELTADVLAFGDWSSSRTIANRACITAPAPSAQSGVPSDDGARCATVTRPLLEPPVAPSSPSETLVPPSAEPTTSASGPDSTTKHDAQASRPLADTGSDLRGLIPLAIGAFIALMSGLITLIARRRSRLIQDMTDQVKN